jgi:hypothetical protein
MLAKQGPWVEVRTLDALKHLDLTMLWKQKRIAGLLLDEWKPKNFASSKMDEDVHKAVMSLDAHRQIVVRQGGSDDGYVTLPEGLPLLVSAQEACLEDWCFKTCNPQDFKAIVNRVRFQNVAFCLKTNEKPIFCPKMVARIVQKYVFTLFFQ